MMNIKYRPAQRADLDDIIKMLADDDLGAQREDLSIPANAQYVEAFDAIDSDSNNELIILESSGLKAPRLIGMLQITYIPYLTHIGSWCCLIEGVRIHKDFRGQGLGTELFQWAIERAKQKDCQMVQLTSNKSRSEAIRFYESLGFVASHEGFKLML